MLNEDQSQAVFEHLEEILQSAVFVRSKRLACFLRFIVHQTIYEPDEILKERTIGISVFERPLYWDPKTDTIVRSEARRLRKNLAKYYSVCDETNRRVRIDVPTGGYVPVFHFEQRVSPELSTGDLPTLTATESSEPIPSDIRLAVPSQRTPHPYAGISIMSALSLTCVLLVMVLLSGRSAVSAHLSRFSVSPFTWEQGSEFSPAISPDERQLAYVWDRGGRFSIYLKSVEGGRPRLLSERSLPELSPGWSPSGKEIAFLRVGAAQTDVVVRRLSDGVERTVGTIANQMSGWSDLPGPLVGDIGPAWTPDGNNLIVMDRAPHVAQSGLYDISLSTGERRELTNPQGIAEDLLPRVSPDGQTLAFVRMTTRGVGNIFLLNLETLKLREVTHESACINGLAWSDKPDELIFSSNRNGSFQLWAIRTSDQAIEEINTNSANAVDPQIASRGEWLAYVSEDASWDIDRIRIGSGMNAKPDPLITSLGRNRDGQYSPDGKHIAFVSDRSGAWEIWVCDTAGDDPVMLTHFGGAWVGGLSWSPDSRQIAFDARMDGRSALYRISLANPAPKRVGRDNFEERLPSWSDDGKYLIFNSDRSGAISLWEQNLVSGAVQKVGGQSSFYDAHELASDGTWVVGGIDGTLWRIQPGEATPVKLPGGVRADPILGWTTHGGATYYCSKNGDSTRVFEYSPAGKRLIASIQEPLYDGSLNVSPDGRYLLVSVIAHSSSHIYLRRSRPQVPDAEVRDAHENLWSLDQPQVLPFISPAA